MLAPRPISSPTSRRRATPSPPHRRIPTPRIGSAWPSCGCAADAAVLAHDFAALATPTEGLGVAFTQKFIEIDFSMAQGNFQGGGNTYTAKGLRIHTTIVKAGGASFGEAEIEIYGLPLSVMNQLLSTFGAMSFSQSKVRTTLRSRQAMIRTT